MNKDRFVVSQYDDDWFYVEAYKSPPPKDEEQQEPDQPSKTMME